MQKHLLLVAALSLCMTPSISRAADDPNEQAIRQLEKDMDDALLKANVQALDRILAEGFACKTGDAGLISKPALLEYLKANGSAWQAIADQDISTSKFDGDTVIVTGLSMRRYKGTNDLLKLRFTRIYSKINHHWQLAAMHAEELP